MAGDDQQEAEVDLAAEATEARRQAVEAAEAAQACKEQLEQMKAQLEAAKVMQREGLVKAEVQKHKQPQIKVGKYFIEKLFKWKNRLIFRSGPSKF